ncbi:hypothetical protein IJX73_02845 [bacterium]|nr:hypothetical protein [bacterium]
MLDFLGVALTITTVCAFFFGLKLARFIKNKIKRKKGSIFVIKNVLCALTIISLMVLRLIFKSNLIIANLVAFLPVLYIFQCFAIYRSVSTIKKGQGNFEIKQQLLLEFKKHNLFDYWKIQKSEKFVLYSKIKNIFIMALFVINGAIFTFLCFYILLALVKWSEIEIKELLKPNKLSEKTFELTKAQWCNYSNVN